MEGGAGAKSLFTVSVQQSVRQRDGGALPRRRYAYNYAFQIEPRSFFQLPTVVPTEANENDHGECDPDERMHCCYMKEQRKWGLLE